MTNKVTFLGELEQMLLLAVVRLESGAYGMAIRSELETQTGRSVARIVQAVGHQAGLTAPVRPHGLRHAAITDALNLTRGDVRAVQRFSRHRDLRVLTVYDDNREDLGGAVARLVAGAVKR